MMEDMGGTEWGRRGGKHNPNFEDWSIFLLVPKRLTQCKTSASKHVAWRMNTIFVCNKNVQ